MARSSFCCQRVNRVEPVQVNTGRNDHNFVRVGAVQPDGLRFVQRAACHDAVGLLHDCGLGCDALFGGEFVRGLGYLVFHVP